VATLACPSSFCTAPFFAAPPEGELGRDGAEAGIGFENKDLPLTQDNAVGFRCAR
jgi:hypothetical protein